MTGPQNTMRVCSICVTLALGGFAQKVSQSNRVFSTRRWTVGVVKEKVLYRVLPLHYFCRTVSPILHWGGILSFTGEHFLPTT